MSRTFSKDQRLSSKKVIQELFKKSSSFFSYPYKVLYANAELPVTAVSHSQVLVSVSKKHFKRAVWRNRIRRQIKEAYRTQRPDYATLPTYMVFIYVGKQAEPYALLAEKMQFVLRHLAQIQEKSHLK